MSGVNLRIILPAAVGSACVGVEAGSAHDTSEGVGRGCNACGRRQGDAKHV